MDGFSRIPRVGRVKDLGGLEDVLRFDIVGDVNNLSFGFNIKNDSFHNANERVVEPEVGGECYERAHPSTWSPETCCIVTGINRFLSESGPSRLMGI